MSYETHTMRGCKQFHGTARCFGPTFRTIRLLLLLAAAGCSPEQETSQVPAAPRDAETILQRMRDAYAQATSYADRGVVRLNYRADGRWQRDEGRLSVRFARPDRLLVRIYQLTLANDGQRWQAAIADQSTRNMDGQVVVRTSPERLTLEEVYDDPLILSVVAGGMGGPPIALELLLSDQPLEHVFGSDVRRELLDDAPIQGHICHRVRVTLPGGPLVFWIDRETFVLRRMEYPAEPLAAQLAPEGGLESLTLVAEMRDAVLNADLSSERFGFDVSDEARLVRRFVLPPEPLASSLYGQRPADFHVTDLEGNRISQQQLLGRPAVLTWFNLHPASESCLQELSRLQEQHFPEDSITFLAVCTEPTSVSNRQLRQWSARHNLAMPVVRDLAAFGRDVFEIPGAPTMVVLDEQGMVHFFQVGMTADFVEELREVLRSLQIGDNPAARRLALAEQQRQQYEQQLSEVLEPLPPSARPARDTRR